MASTDILEFPPTSRSLGKSALSECTDTVSRGSTGLNEWECITGCVTGNTSSEWKLLINDCNADWLWRVKCVMSLCPTCRQEFDSENVPDLTEDVYMQGIHCVGSLQAVLQRAAQSAPHVPALWQVCCKFSDTCSFTRFISLWPSLLISCRCSACIVSILNQ